MHIFFDPTSYLSKSYLVMTSPLKASNSIEQDKVEAKKDKGKSFTPTNWTESVQEQQTFHNVDLKRAPINKPINKEEELLPDEEDDSFHLESEDLGSESSQNDSDSLDDEYDEEDSFVEGGDSCSKTSMNDSIRVEQDGSSHNHDSKSLLENEVDELLKEIQENVEYDEGGLVELVQPGTLRSGKRKRDFVVEEYAKPFHEDLTIVGRGIGQGHSNGTSSKR